MRNTIYLYLLLALGGLNSATAWSAPSKDKPIAEADWAQRLEEEYFAYLEDQLNFWNAERFGQGQAMSDLSNKDAPDIAQATEEFRAESIRLNELLSDAEAAPFPWTKKLAHNIRDARLQWQAAHSGNDDEQKRALEQIKKHFDPLVAKKFSPLRWQAIRDVYGVEVEEKLLQDSFLTKAWTSNGQQKNQYKSAAEQIEIVWIEDPWLAVADELGQKSMNEYAKLAQKTLSARDISELSNSGLKITPITISSYESLESQAAELLHTLRTKYLEEAKHQIVILSSGQASAIVHELFDLNPELRSNRNISAWINWNGRLQGMPLRESIFAEFTSANKDRKARALASIATPAELTPQFKLFRELTQAQLSRGDITLPLGEGFPIYSVVPRDAAERSSPELRESLVVDGTNLLVDGAAAKMPSPVIQEILAKVSAD